MKKIHLNFSIQVKKKNDLIKLINDFCLHLSLLSLQKIVYKKNKLTPGKRFFFIFLLRSAAKKQRVVEVIFFLLYLFLVLNRKFCNRLQTLRLPFLISIFSMRKFLQARHEKKTKKKNRTKLARQYLNIRIGNLKFLKFVLKPVLIIVHYQESVTSCIIS